MRDDEDIALETMAELLDPETGHPWTWGSYWDAERWELNPEPDDADFGRLVAHWLCED